MARALAFVQLLIISLSVFTLHLLLRLHHATPPAAWIADLAQFVSRYGLWMMVIPVIWAVLGTLLQVQVGPRTVKAAGLILTALVALIFLTPLLAYLV